MDLEIERRLSVARYDVDRVLSQLREYEKQDVLTRDSFAIERTIGAIKLIISIATAIIGTTSISLFLNQDLPIITIIIAIGMFMLEIYIIRNMLELHDNFSELNRNVCGRRATCIDEGIMGFLPEISSATEKVIKGEISILDMRKQLSSFQKEVFGKIDTINKQILEKEAPKIFKKLQAGRKQLVFSLFILGIVVFLISTRIDLVAMLFTVLNSTISLMQGICSR